MMVPSLKQQDQQSTLKQVQVQRHRATCGMTQQMVSCMCIQDQHGYWLDQHHLQVVQHQVLLYQQLLILQVYHKLILHILFQTTWLPLQHKIHLHQVQQLQDFQQLLLEHKFQALYQALNLQEQQLMLML